MAQPFPHQAAFDAIGDGVVVHDPDTGAVLDVNERMCEMHGYTREEFLALQVEEFSVGVPPPNQTEARTQVRKAATEGPQEVQWLNQRKDGELFRVEVSLRCIELEGAERVIATVRDISEHEEHEGSLRTYERLQEVLQRLPVYMFTQDRDLRYTWVSNTVTGIDPESVLGQTDEALFPDEEAKRLQKVKRRVLEMGEPAHAELQGTLDGTLYFFETYLVPQRDEMDAVTGLVGATVDVTERRRAEQEGQKSERRYRQLFETARDGIVIQSSDRTIVDINPAGLDILGYSRDELEDIDPAALFADIEQRERGQELIREEGAIHDMELNLRRKDGEEIVCQVSAAAQQDEAGTTEAYYTIFRDVTERRRREEQFRLLVEEVKEYAIFMLDPEGYVTTWNTGAETIKGYAKDEILGEHFSVFYPVEDVEAGKPNEALEVAAREGQWVDEGWRMREDGSRFWARVTVTALRDEAGQLRGFARVTHDMTERRKQEEALRESEEKFRVLAEESLIGIAMLQDRVYTYVNPAFADIFGYASEEIIDQSPEMLFHPADWPDVYERLQKRFEGTLQEAHYEARVVTKEGEVRYVEVRGSRTLYQGKPTILGTVLDVTERRQLQERLLRVQDEERQRLGQELHDGVASQLTVAAMATSSLAGEVKRGKQIAPGDLEKATEFIKKAAEEARALSHGLRPVGLEQGLSPALEELASQAEMRDELSCSYEAVDPLPNLSEDAAIHLYRIAQEAVSNAVKHAEADHVWVRLATDDEGALILTVQDNGRGYSGSSMNDEGLGMRTMRHRANLINSSLTVEKAPEGGTIIQCRLPQHRDQSVIVTD